MEATDTQSKEIFPFYLFLTHGSSNVLNYQLLISINLKRNLNVSCKPQFLVGKVVSAAKLGLFKKFNVFATALELELCA